MDAPWHIELLGGLRATQGDHVVSRFRSQKIRSLLAFLAYHSHRSHPRETLIEMLWPECDPAAGRQRLRQALHLLRHQLEPPGIPAGAVIQANHTVIQLNPAACTTDVAQFEAALQSAAQADSGTERTPRLIEAVDLCRGELLPGCFEDWVLPERQRLAEAYLQGLHQLVGLLERLGDLQKALQYARRAIAMDPLREEAQHTLIRLQVAAGQPAAALRQYHELERLLARELTTAPAPETRALVAEIRSGAGAEAPPAAPGARVSFSGHLGPEAPYASQPVSSVPAPASVRTASTDPMPAREGHLPLQLTRFFGREREIAHLCEAVGQESSAVGDGGTVPTDGRKPKADGPTLITLTGPGGSGKTRLAIQVARQLRSSFSGGVWFVPLLDLSDPGLIPDQILQSLSLPRSPDTQPLDQVGAFLSARPSLLVLDNFEQLVAGGAERVKTLLERTETLTLLITSRQRLDLPGEREFPVPRLPVPDEGPWSLVDGPTMTDPSDPSDPSEPSTLAACPSVALFLDRAQAVRPDFQLTKSNGGAVAALCARLEGLPLALELAAVRIGVLTPAQMLAHLNQRFELLVSRQRGADPRHRSLRAALDWSYQLLSPDLQRFFARLSVFRGGWTLAVAHEVCEQPRALDYLSQLRESSLVLAEESGGEMRFRSLETLREYASEQLAPEERAQVARRHASCYLGLVERAEPGLYGPNQSVWFDRLERERDNLLAALAWCIGGGTSDPRAGVRSNEAEEETAASQAVLSPDHGSPDAVEIGLRIATVLRHFWLVRGDDSDGRRWLRTLLSLPGASAPTAIRARALDAAGKMATYYSDDPAARPLLEEGLAIARTLGSTKIAHDILWTFGELNIRQGDYPHGCSLLDESLVLARELGETRAIAASLCALAKARAHHEDFQAARPLFDESVELFRQGNNHRGLGWSLEGLGDLAARQGDGETEQACYEESLAVRRVIDFKSGVPLLLYKLALLAWRRGDDRRAMEQLREALVGYRQSSLENGIAFCLAGVGLVAAARGQAERAARLLAAAGKRWPSEDAAELLPHASAEADEREQAVSRLRAALGAVRFRAAWSEGQDMAIEEAIAVALEFGEPDPPGD